MKDTSKTFGARIKELRDAKDLSLREFGKTLGVTAAFLSDVELGRRYPSDKLLAEMARALGTTVDELKSYDMRPMVAEIKQLVTQNPAFGFAFRRMLEKDVTAKELIELVERKPNRTKT